MCSISIFKDKDTDGSKKPILDKPIHMESYKAVSSSDQKLPRQGGNDREMEVEKKPEEEIQRIAQAAQAEIQTIAQAAQAEIQTKAQAAHAEIQTIAQAAQAENQEIEPDAQAGESIQKILSFVMLLAAAVTILLGLIPISLYMFCYFGDEERYLQFFGHMLYRPSLILAPLVWSAASLKILFQDYQNRKTSWIDIPDFLENMQQLQPFMLALGDRECPEQVFVVMAGKIISCGNSLLKALDICLKVIYVLDMDYPWECQNTWDFIQKCIYGLGEGKGKAPLPQVLPC